MTFLKWWIQLGLRRYERSVFVSVYIVALPRDTSDRQGLIVLDTEQTR